MPISLYELFGLILIDFFLGNNFVAERDLKVGLFDFDLYF